MFFPLTVEVAFVHKLSTFYVCQLKNKLDKHRYNNLFNLIQKLVK